MILTLHVPGTTVKRVQESLKVYIPPLKPETTSRSTKSDKAVDHEKQISNDENRKNKKGNLIQATLAIQDKVNPSDDAESEVIPTKNNDLSDNAEESISENQAGIAQEGGDQKPVTFQVAINQLSSVIISGNVSITVPVLQHLAKNAVPVIFTEKNKPIAVLNPFAAHGSVRVRKEQFAAIDSERGFYIAKRIIGGALENKARILLGLAKNRAANKPELEKTLRDIAQTIRDGSKKIDVLKYAVDPVVNRFNLMGIEGDGSKEYFSALEKIIPPVFNFSGRNRRPPRDPVNAMLSFGYTILQGYITLGIAAVGLEPFAGFLHADRSGKPSLVLDMMEEFRQPVVDKLIISLVTKGIIKPTHFLSTSTGVLLTEAGRNIFVTRLVKRVAPLRPDEAAKAADKNYYKDIIKQSRDLSKFLLGQSPEYTPHVMDW
nr:CRISPR-associated endonuclease Cas1 [Candidatus Sigynarchaeota archaeon]